MTMTASDHRQAAREHLAAADRALVGKHPNEARAAHLATVAAAHWLTVIADTLTTLLDPDDGDVYAPVTDHDQHACPHAAELEEAQATIVDLQQRLDDVVGERMEHRAQVNGKEVDR